MSKPILTYERLRELLDYNSETGVFTWIKVTSPRVRVGNKAGAVGSSGYWSIQIDSNLYLTHRLAWMFVVGEFPPDCVDHINGDGTDNRFCNLRAVTKCQNLQNQKVRSIYSGVSPHGSGWRAKITANKVVHYLGIFPSPASAHAAYLAAKQQLHGEYSR